MIRGVESAMQKFTVEVDMDSQEVKVHEAIAQEECAKITVESSATRIAKSRGRPCSKTHARRSSRA